MPANSNNVCSWSGKVLLVVSLTGFDPNSDIARSFGVPTFEARFLEISAGQSTPPQSGPAGRQSAHGNVLPCRYCSRNHSTKGSFRQRASARRSVMHPSDHAPEQKAVIGQSETEVVIRPFDPLTAIRADWI